VNKFVYIADKQIIKFFIVWVMQISLI
jgi:hypothetical protein